MLNAESEAEQDLYATPETRLWQTVLLQAVVHLKDSTEWLSKSLEREAPGLRDCERDDQRGHASPLRDQMQKHVRRVREAEQFFFRRGSTFGEICELLGYDQGEFRSTIAAWLGERAEVLQKAEAFVDAIAHAQKRREESGAETREVSPKSSTVSPRIPLISRPSAGSRESR